MAQLAVAADAGSFGSFDQTAVKTVVKIIEVDVLYLHWPVEQMRLLHLILLVLILVVQPSLHKHAES